MTQKYTAKIMTRSYYEPQVTSSFTGTLEELTEWGYCGDPFADVLNSPYNPFNGDLFMTEDAMKPTGEPVRGYRWWNDGHGDYPADIPAYEDPNTVMAIDSETYDAVQNGDLELEELSYREIFPLHPKPLGFTYENVLDYLKYTCEDSQHHVKLEPAS